MALTMYRGDTQAFDVTVTQGGSAYNLNNAAGLYFTARKEYGSPVVFQKSVGSGIAVTNAAGGLATITLSPADTSSITPTPVKMVVDLEVETTGGAIYTAYRGTLAVEPDITAR